MHLAPLGSIFSSPWTLVCTMLSATSSILSTSVIFIFVRTYQNLLSPCPCTSLSYWIWHLYFWWFFYFSYPQINIQTHYNKGNFSILHIKLTSSFKVYIPSLCMHISNTTKPSTFKCERFTFFLVHTSSRILKFKVSESP